MGSVVTRRGFVGWMGWLAAALGFGRRPAAARRLSAASLGVGTAAPLDERSLRALAEAVLPAEIGADGAAHAAWAFGRWLDGYHAGAEAVHGYGNAQIRVLGPSPAERWTRQLAALVSESVAKHGKPFAQIAVSERAELVRAALATERLDRMPAPLSAGHVAVGLLAHFYASPDATDLCYNAQVGKNRCRPLVNSPKEPIAIHKRAAAPRPRS
jgi:hypothetical protein